MSNKIVYTGRHNDGQYIYREVILPSEIAKKLPNPPKLLSESEWRELGVNQSVGWIHYHTYPPEPHVLLFRRNT